MACNRVALVEVAGFGHMQSILKESIGHGEGCFGGGKRERHQGRVPELICRRCCLLYITNVNQIESIKE